MSNRVVPQVYRSVIDDVIKSIRADYQENGVEDDVLVYLQRRWEANLVESRVARFDSDADVKPHVAQQQQQHASGSGAQGNGYYQTTAGQVKHESGMTHEELLRLRGGSLDDDDDVKPGLSDDEDDDDFDADDLGLGIGGGASGAAAFSKLSKYAKSSPPETSLPTSVNPADLNAAGSSRAPGTAGAPSAAVTAGARPVPGTNRGNGNAGGSRGIPDENGLLPGDEIIDSDLDDDDEDDDDEDGDGSDAEDEQDTDYMLCVYDKVQRVKNKWKTTFKDGLIHVDGKDYLFSKCTGEFEW